MNLKDWDALSGEGQRKYWERATLGERRELIDSGMAPINFAYLSAKANNPGIVFEQISPAPKTTDIHSCCESAKWLKEQIEDEVKANHDYQLASEFTEGYPLADEIIHQIALDEARHRFLVEGLAKELSKWCKCEQKIDSTIPDFTED
jgi:hypothetical protein